MGLEPPPPDPTLAPPPPPLKKNPGGGGEGGICWAPLFVGRLCVAPATKQANTHVVGLAWHGGGVGCMAFVMCVRVFRVWVWDRRRWTLNRRRVLVNRRRLMTNRLQVPAGRRSVEARVTGGRQCVLWPLQCCAQFCRPRDPAACCPVGRIVPSRCAVPGERGD